MKVLREIVRRAVARMGHAAAFAVVLTASFDALPARAQTSYAPDRPPQVAPTLQGSAAYNGYRAGFSRGAENLSEGLAFDAGTDVVFLRADGGYSPDLGSRVEYQSAFRTEFARGYGDASSSRASEPMVLAPPPPPEPRFAAGRTSRAPDRDDGASLRMATARGYDAGYSQGSADALRMATYGYRDNPVYLAANAGFDSALGDVEKYQAVFRQIYARGYSDGFNGRARYTTDSGQV